MKNNIRGTTGDLLTCFFRECESQFRFLEQKHGCSYLSGLVEYRGGRQLITPYRDGYAGESFTAVTRYERDARSLEILYSDHDFIIESFVCYDHIYRLSLGEMLSAAKKQEPGRTRHWLVTQEDLVRDSVGGIARTVRKHWKHFLQPPQKTIDRALTIRARRLEQAVREQHKKDIEFACREAAIAFMEKNYVEVVMLLLPYENYLGSSDAKKLALARRHLLDGAQASE